MPVMPCVPVTPHACDDCVQFIVCVANFFFFPAQLAATQQELNRVRDAAAAASGSNRTPTQIERPRKVNTTNLQVAMGLANDNATYNAFRVSVHSYL